MNETQLAIVISVINDAADQLAEIGTQLGDLAGQTATDASEMSSSMTAATTAITEGFSGAEGAIAEAAAQSIQAWGGFSDEMTETIPGVTEAAYDSISEMWLKTSEAAGASAQSSVASWQESLGELEGLMSKEGAALDEAFAGVTGEAVAAATTMGEEAGTAAAEGFGGYFQKMIIGYALEQIGTFLSGGVQSAIASVSKSSDQIATLTAQIQQQKAEIQVNEAALQKWVGTTAEVNAAHGKAAANIDAEKVKITELTQQLAPLTQTQQGLTGEIESTVNEVLKWVGAHKQLENELQTFTTTMGPMLKYIGEALIVITLMSVALTALDPAMLILIGVAVVIAGLTAIWQTFHTQIVTFFDDLNAKTGIITFLQQAWDLVVQEFEGKLMPALKKLWDALQPLAPFLQALAVVVGATLLGALVLLVDILTTAVTWFVDVLTAATNLATFFSNVLVGAITSVENALNAVFNSAAFKAVSGLVGGAVSAGGSILSAVAAAVPKFATGGIVSSPTLALVGEAGPEAIIPLSAFSGGGSLGGGTGSGGGSGNIIVNINGGSYLNQGGAQQIAQALATMINQQLKLKIR